MSSPDFKAEMDAIHAQLLAAYKRGVSDAFGVIVSRAVEGGVPAGQKQPEAATVTVRQFPPRSWTPEEENFLRGAWGKMTFEALSQKFNRSVDAIRLRGRILGQPRLPANHQFKEG